MSWIHTHRHTHTTRDRIFLVKDTRGWLLGLIVVGVSIAIAAESGVAAGLLAFVIGCCIFGWIYK